jgi:hypothetical protein
MKICRRHVTLNAVGGGLTGGSPRKKVLEHKTHKTHKRNTRANCIPLFMAPLLSLCCAIEETNALRLLRVVAKLVFA